MYIYTYALASQGANALKDQVEAKFIRKKNSKFRGSPFKNVINWGCIASNEEVEKSNLLNSPKNVRKASNKLLCFQELKDKVITPPWSVDIDEVQGWVDEGATVVARETLNGHSGEGIVLIDSPLKWEEYDHRKAQLYTKYIPKLNEYRVHVFLGKVICVKRKGTRLDRGDVDYRVRTHNNGFIYINTLLEEVEPKVVEQALASTEALGLDFGAVDVIYNKYKDTAYVLEVNTAPGIEGSTVIAYGEAIKAWSKGEEVQPQQEIEEEPDEEDDYEEGEPEDIGHADEWNPEPHYNRHVGGQWGVNQPIRDRDVDIARLEQIIREEQEARDIARREQQQGIRPAFYNFNYIADDNQ